MKLRFVAILLILVITTSPTVVRALQPKRTVVHNMDFIMQNKNVTLNVPSKNFDAREVLSKIIQDNGGQIETSFFKKLIAPKITLRHVKTITGARGDNALSIDVSAKKIVISYTTESSLQRALELLSTSVTTKYGCVVFQGTDIIDWTDGNEPRIRAGDLDLTTAVSLMPRSRIEEFIARTRPGTEIRLTLVSKDGWIIESRPLENINHTTKIYAEIGFYTLSQLKAINDYAASRGVEISMGVHILEPNAQFENVTGFPLNSVEGMRFLRALITDWSENTGITKFYVGKPTTNDDPRYRQFIRFMDDNLNVDFIYE